MPPEIGNIFLIFAFSISVLSFLSATYSYYADVQIYDLSKNIYLIFFLLLASFFVLEFSFLTDDFSVLYVANNSNPNLPAYYKFSALWGGHEGSLLLFVLIISIWMMVFSLMSSYSKIEDKNLVLSFCHLVLFSLLGFIIFSSNPFTRFCFYYSPSNIIFWLFWSHNSIFPGFGSMFQCKRRLDNAHKKLDCTFLVIFNIRNCFR